MSATLCQEMIPNQVVKESVEQLSVLQRIADGDESAVSECLDKYGGLVWTLAKRMSPSDAEDATQDIFVEIWQTADRFDPDKSSEANFIGMIARRRMIDRLRRKRPSEEKNLDDAVLEVIDSNEVDRVELKDEAAKAADCMDKLSPKHNEVLTLSIHHGYSHTRIADRLSLPLGSVKSFARRALIQVRDCMNRPIESLTGESR